MLFASVKNLILASIPVDVVLFDSNMAESDNVTS